MASGTIPKYADGSDSGWLSLENSTVFTGKIKYRKVGNQVDICFFSLNLVTEFTVGSGNLDLGTLPSGYRPTAYPNDNSSDHYVTFPIRIYVGGNVNNNFSYAGTIFDWGLIRIYADKNALAKIPTTASICGSAHYFI